MLFWKEITFFIYLYKIVVVYRLLVKIIIGSWKKNINLTWAMILVKDA